MPRTYGYVTLPGRGNDHCMGQAVAPHAGLSNREAAGREKGGHATCWLPAGYVLALKAGGGHQPRNAAASRSCKRKKTGVAPDPPERHAALRAPRCQPGETHVGSLR